MYFPLGGGAQRSSKRMVYVLSEFCNRIKAVSLLLLENKEVVIYRFPHRDDTTQIRILVEMNIIRDLF